MMVSIFPGWNDNSFSESQYLEALNLKYFPPYFGLDEILIKHVQTDYILLQ